ncbi:monocarboxylate transporter 4 isoform X1 [Chaetodon auriga]|uniref:monocarboxylate transporter 4 isoform X1 n=1 Tax=Chaetodon auriga TaxID=39042 RepID=UPI004032BEB0
MGGAVVDDGPPGVKAPDGGWGWAVLAGCFIITGFSYAFPKAVSVFFKELIREYDVGYSDTAWISSILLAMLYGTGPLCSVLVNRFGCRPVMMVGGLLASLGMILASFATSIMHIYLCTGVITGLGLALNFQPSLIMLNRYFSEKRPLANGLAAAGSPVALCCLSPLGQILQYQYGWRGGFLILGGMLLNCCACGALMRPLLFLKKPQELDGAVRERKAEPKKKLLDFSVFKDRGFVIYAIAASVMVLGLFVPPVFVVNYAKGLGYEDTKSALLLTILGFVDMFARPVSGLIAGMKCVRPRAVYMLSFAIIFNGCTDIIGSQVTMQEWVLYHKENGEEHACMPQRPTRICSHFTNILFLSVAIMQANDYTGLVVFCIFFGISYGMVGALQFEVLMAIVGTEKFSSAIGLVLLMEAIAVLVGPPGAGLLLDATHQYMYVFLLAGCEVTLSAFVITLGNILCIRRKPEDPQTMMEMADTVSEKEGLNCKVEGEEDDEGQEGKEDGNVASVKAGEMMVVKEMGDEGQEENTSL